MTIKNVAQLMDVKETLIKALDDSIKSDMDSGTRIIYLDDVEWEAGKGRMKSADAIIVSFNHVEWMPGRLQGDQQSSLSIPVPMRDVCVSLAIQPRWGDMLAYYGQGTQAGVVGLRTLKAVDCYDGGIGLESVATGIFIQIMKYLIADTQWVHDHQVKGFCTNVVDHSLTVTTTNPEGNVVFSHHVAGDFYPASNCRVDTNNPNLVEGISIAMVLNQENWDMDIGQTWIKNIPVQESPFADARRLVIGGSSVLNHGDFDPRTYPDLNK